QEGSGAEPAQDWVEDLAPHGTHADPGDRSDVSAEVWELLCKCAVVRVLLSAAEQTERLPQVAQFFDAQAGADPILEHGSGAPPLCRVVHRIVRQGPVGLALPPDRG